MRLLCIQWNEGGLPDDDEVLAGYGRGDTPLAKVKAKFKRCRDGKLRNERMEIVRDNLQKFAKKCSDKGKAGAQKRWGGHFQALPNDSSPTPTPTPTPVMVGTAAETDGQAKIPWPTILKWLMEATASGADYQEIETRSAWLALEANGWMWGKNPVVDYRAAIERQIQTDRNHNEKIKPNNSQRVNRNVGTSNEQTDLDAKYARIRARKAVTDAGTPPSAGQ